jgi:AcrB/AcrD/AcrF family
VEHTLVSSDWPVVELRSDGTAKNGLRFDNRYCWVCRFVNATTVEVRAYLDTVDNPKGTITGPRRSFTIYTNDQLTRSQDWNDVIVAYRNGGPLRVRDIGQAVTGPQDTTQAAWADGKPSIVLVVYKQPDANVIETVDAIKAALPRLQSTMPPSIRVFTLSDRTQTISGRNASLGLGGPTVHSNVGGRLSSISEVEDRGQW